MGGRADFQRQTRARSGGRAVQQCRGSASWIIDVLQGIYKPECATPVCTFSSPLVFSGCADGRRPNYRSKSPGQRPKKKQSPKRSKPVPSPLDGPCFDGFGSMTPCRSPSAIRAKPWLTKKPAFEGHERLPQQKGSSKLGVVFLYSSQMRSGPLTCRSF